MKALLLRHTVARRLVTIPVMLLLLVVTIALTPLAVVLGGLLGLRAGGRYRIVRVTLFTLSYLAAESAGLLAAVWLWVRAGMGTRVDTPRSRDAHYALLAALLHWLYRVSCPLFDLRVDAPMELAPGRHDTPQLPATPGRPLLVLSRHAGPGDSFLLVHALLAVAHRRPRIVLKRQLCFDPLIDVILGRLPHCFVGEDPDSGPTSTETIGRITGTMGPQDALLIFPEGGNFTAQRRRRIIASLRRRGLVRESASARRLHNVLPPRPGGVFTAVDAAPHADLVFVAHTGLDHIQTVLQAWQGIPLAHPVEIAWRTMPTESVPSGEEERLRWLERKWVEIDAWIDRWQPASPN